MVLNYLKNPAGYGKNRKKSHKSKLFERDKHEIVRIASNSQKPLQQIKQELNLSVCRETICQALVKSPYIKTAKKAKTPNLTPVHIERRLNFAKTNMDRQWTSVSCQLDLLFETNISLI